MKVLVMISQIVYKESKNIYFLAVLQTYMFPVTRQKDKRYTIFGSPGILFYVCIHIECIKLICRHKGSKCSNRLGLTYYIYIEIIGSSNGFT